MTLFHQSLFPAQFNLKNIYFSTYSYLHSKPVNNYYRALLYVKKCKSTDNCTLKTIENIFKGSEWSVIERKKGNEKRRREKRLKVNGLREVYSPKLLEPTIPRCQVIVLVTMSHCMNFTVFSFIMVSNNKKVCTISECYVASIV